MPDTTMPRTTVRPRAKRNPRTAAEAYAGRANRVRALLGCVEDALEAHAQRAATSPNDWGFAGDLGAAEELLKRALAQLGGAGGACLEQALGEMEGGGD